MSERKTIDADKALLHMTFAGRRLLIAHIITCIAFIIAIVFFTTQNTQREQQIIDQNAKRDQQIIEIITHLHCGEPITEVLNGTAPE